MKLRLKNTNLLFICVLIIGWIIYGCYCIPTLFNISFLREDTPIHQVSLDWLLDKNWVMSQCEDKTCRLKGINESNNEFSIAIDQVENSLLKKKQLEVTITANADRKNPSSVCYNQSINNCLGLYSKGLGEQALNPNLTTDEAMSIVNKLKVLNLARLGTSVIELNNDSISKTLGHIGLALSRDIKEIPTSDDQVIESIYNQHKDNAEETR